MKFLRALMLGVFALAAAALPAAAQSTKADDTFKVAIHVTDRDPAKLNVTLNNVQNILADMKKAGRKVDIQVVGNGDGLHMFREDTSPVKARIQEISLANSNVTFNACGNTQARMSKAENKDIKLMSEAKLVSSGVVHVVELQRQGYAYLKP